MNLNIQVISHSIQSKQSERIGTWKNTFVPEVHCTVSSNMKIDFIVYLVIGFECQKIV